MTECQHLWLHWPPQKGRYICLICGNEGARVRGLREDPVTGKRKKSTLNIIDLGKLASSDTTSP